MLAAHQLPNDDRHARSGSWRSINRAMWWLETILALASLERRPSLASAIKSFRSGRDFLWIGLFRARINWRQAEAWPHLKAGGSFCGVRLGAHAACSARDSTLRSTPGSPPGAAALGRAVALPTRPARIAWALLARAEPIERALAAPSGGRDGGMEWPSAYSIAGDDDIDRNGRDRRSGEPVPCHAIDSACFDRDPIGGLHQPAAMAAVKGRIHGCRTLR